MLDLNAVADYGKGHRSRSGKIGFVTKNCCAASVESVFFPVIRDSIEVRGDLIGLDVYASIV